MPSENTDEAILFHCHCDDATLIIKRYLSTNSEMKNTHTHRDFCRYWLYL